MKKSLLTVAIALNLVLAYAQDNRVLMNIAGDEISVAEFLGIYNKNNTNNVIDKKSVEEYVDLFVNFKLKVKEAEVLGMDTAKKFINELAGYRRQLAQPYLVDRETSDKLIQEAFDRMKEDVAAYHLLIMVDENAPAADTLAALKKIADIRKTIKSEKDMQNTIAKFKADDDKNTVGEDLGYFTAFSMVYPFESAAYNTPVGSVSKPVRTRFGYHILYIKDRRPARGEIKVAHIMLKNAADLTDNSAGDAKARIDEIYSRLIKGENFQDLVKEYSEDKMTVPQGGTLPWFGTGRMDPAFEDAAFALQKNGDYSSPIQTKYGWHIILREDYKGIGDFDELKNAIKKKIEKDSRGQEGRTALLSKLKSEYIISIDAKNRDAANKMVPKEYMDGSWKYKGNSSLSTPVITMTDNKYSKRTIVYTQNDYLDYLSKYQRRPQPNDPKVVSTLETMIKQQWDGFVNATIIRFEDSNLEAKYPEFRALMQEYHDGILLFDLMDQKVWSMAVKDTLGLQRFYASHTSDYMWPDRVDATIYNCANQRVADQCMKQAKSRIKKGYTDTDILKSLNAENPLNLTIKSGLFAKGDEPAVDAVKWGPGIYEQNGNGGKASVVQIYSIKTSAPKALDECRGLVTSAYQNQLEKEWIAELRSKYRFSINDQVLGSIKQF